MTALTDRLATLGTYLEKTTQDLQREDITADQLGPVTSYLYALIEHAWKVASMACGAFDTSDATHRVRQGFDGGNLDVALSNTSNLLEVLQTITCDATHLVRKLNSDPS